MTLKHLLGAAAACSLLMTQAFLSAPAAAPVIRKNGMAQVIQDRELSRARL